METIIEARRRERTSLMSCNLLTWNMRGSRDKAKATILRRKIRKLRP